MIVKARLNASFAQKLVPKILRLERDGKELKSQIPSTNHQANLNDQ
jgi:hypothetical protein